MTIAKSCVAISAAVLAGVVFASPATAQYKPKDKITVLQGFAPGGGSDQLAQLVQPYLTKALDVTFLNVYQPGAAGAIAWSQLANRTKADGYTISITNTPMIVANYLLNDAIKYTVKDFAPIANVVTDPGILVVGKDSKFKTIQDFMAAVKANPGRVTVGNSGVGGDDYFSSLFIEKKAGVKLQKVPFAGDGPSWTAAMAGKIDASSNNLGITYPQIKAGNLVPLAIYTDKRHPLLPNVPTLKEIGIDVVAGSSRGYSGPKGMPEELRKQLGEAMAKMMKDPAFLAEAEKQAMTIDPIIGADYEKLFNAMDVDYKDIVADVKQDMKSGK